jgi:hypothetical protein
MQELVSQLNRMFAASSITSQNKQKRGHIPFLTGKHNFLSSNTDDFGGMTFY